MIQQVSINIEIKVERVVDFLLLHRRWFDTPALKLLLSLVPDIESLWDHLLNLRCSSLLL